VLSLQRCRSLLGTDCKLTDAELEQLRRELYALSDVAVGTFCAQVMPAPNNGPLSREVTLSFSLIPHPERQAVEERAAILEYEAGLKKLEAERQAFGEWAQPRREAQKSRSPNRRKTKTVLTSLYDMR